MEIRRRLGYRHLEFQKRRQLFIGVHNEPPSVAAMCVSNERSARF
jgi:hypothetical protein